MALILLLACAALIGWSMVLAAATAGVESQALVRRNTPPRTQQYEVPQIEVPPPDLSKDYDLLDIVLVASVDGKFHALNRTSGRTLWSMSSFATTTSVSAPSALSPLVRTPHTQFDPDLIDYDDSDSQAHETYIIEPQSGDIYVLRSPSAPLQRFPFSMSELVEISPFTSVNGEDTKVFVGRKETSLLLIELETGRIKATLNSECPFMPDDSEEQPIDLDELDGTKPPTSAPTEVYIGRTDYHISIHKKPRPGRPAPPVQELSFSTYGPNNRDNKLQSMYRRTRDDTYIQSLPNGEIVAFRTSSNKSKDDSGVTGAFWGRPFPSPIVAVFDILRQAATPHHHHHHHHHQTHPFVLLQPRPKLQDLFASLDDSAMYEGQPLPNQGSAYVGLVEETGSLFALSPDHYPLVVFGGHEKYGVGAGAGAGVGVPRGGKKDAQGRYIDPPRWGGEPAAENEENEDTLDFCALMPYHARCLVGVRALEDNDVEWRAKRLIDGPKTQTPATQQPMDRTPPPVIQGSWDGDNASGPLIMPEPVQSDRTKTTLPAIIPDAPSSAGLKALFLGGTGPDGAAYASSSGGGGGLWEGIVVTLLFGFLTIWFMWNKVQGRWHGENMGKSKLFYPAVAQQQQQPVIQKAAASEPVSEEVSAAEDGPEPPVRIEANGGAVVVVPDTIPTADAEKSVVEVAPIPPLPERPVEAGPSEPKEDERPPSVDDLGDVPPPVPPKENKVKFTLPLSPVTSVTPALDTPIAVPETPIPNGAALAPTAAEDAEESDGEGEGGAAATPGKRKSRRGRRGKKKKPGAVALADANTNSSGDSGGLESKEEVEVPEDKEKKSSLVITTSTPKSVVQAPTLIVTDTILGFGSHGTVVLEGSLQGRAVAVKRLLNDFVTLAEREVSILQESDDHPNVIRYYYQESQGNFLYIALELCPASLADIVENPDRDAWRDIAINFDPKKALKQITSGLRHLHALKLVHRDIKPQNILISASSLAKGGFGARAPGAKSYRMLISDFGLCKKLETDETSFLPTAHGAMGAGTVGWRAPEIMRGDVKLDELSNGDDSLSSRGSVATVGGSSSSSGTAPSGNRTRLTKSVDIFALGCLFYYTLTNGGHPYGDRFEREANIMRDAKNLATLERFGEEGTEAADLITAMLCPEAKGRPDTATILLHPFFWDAGRRLTFLQDASDRFEIMCRDPRDPNLVALETGAQAVVGHDWHSRLDKIFIDNLGKYRKYDGKSVQDLMRAMRNKKHHYQDLPDNVKRHLGPLPEGFLGYFTRRYPQLFLHVHGVVKETGLHSESMFRAYFELPDS